jgi:anti-sigma regulatory factor (Ser/Thr protein kinase)
VLPETSSLASVRRWAEEVWRAACPGAPESDRHALVLSVHEAFRNVVEHSRPVKDDPIVLEAVRENGALVVRLIHGGEPFDGIAPPPVFDGTRDGGLGVFLMTRGLSRLAYTTTAKGLQQVELTKETRRPRPRPKSDEGVSQ